MDASKNGAIYFSLGTNILSSFLGPRVAIFLEAIAALEEYNFVWKYETDDLKDLPANLRISKWLPQNSILGRLNLKIELHQPNVSG